MKRAAKFAFLLLPALLALLSAGPAGAQEATLSTYWTYDPPGPIDLVSNADVNHDGIDEFIVATRNGEVILLSSNGRPVWNFTLGEGGEIAQITTINVDGDNTPEILVLTAQELILLAGSGEQLWRQPLVGPETAQDAAAGQEAPRALPVRVAPIDRSGEGSEDVVVLREGGLLQLYDGAGEHLWDYATVDAPAAGFPAHFDIADMSGDGLPEVVFSYFGGRFSKLAVIDQDGNNILGRERPLDGRATALAVVPFDPEGLPDIAIGNSLGRVHLYDAAGQQRWFRTPNKVVSSLAAAQLPAGPALLVGSETGVVSAYDADGNRYWRALVSDTADRGVIDMAASPVAAQNNQPAVAVTLGPTGPSTQETAEVYLLDSAGRLLQEEPLVSIPRATRLVDVNRDGLNELLLVSFGRLALADSGTGARKNAPGWNYSILVAPRTVLAADLDQDSRDELLLAASDGRLHMLESEGGTNASFIQNLGTDVPLLSVTRPTPQGPALIVAASTEDGASAIHLLDADGRRSTDVLELPAQASALQLGDVTADNEPDILIGMVDGQVAAYRLNLELIWEARISDRVTRLLILEGDRLLAQTRSNDLYLLDSNGNSRLLVNYNLRNIVALHALPAGNADEAALLVTTDDGSLRGLTWGGREVWRRTLSDGRPTVTIPAGDHFLIATDSGRIYELDVAYNLSEWSLEGGAPISSLIWADLNGGGLEDLAVGRRNGSIEFYSMDRRLWDQQALTSGIFALFAVQRGPNQPAELVAVTDLGVVQLFEARPNRPPLLINPRTDVQPGSYEISVEVLDDAEDEVVVALEIYDESGETWQSLGTQTAEGSMSLAFAFTPSGNGPVHYRFHYNDQTHGGFVQPPPGQNPIMVNPLLNAVVGPAVFLLLLLSIVILVRQALSPEAQARRFYGRIKQQPEATLALLAAEYARASGSPGLLLNLANRARQEKNMVLANLTDGLFLLTARPDAGLPIISGALESARELHPPWAELSEWQAMFKLGQTLLEAPNITELSLLHPQLTQLVRDQEEMDQIVPGMSMLSRVLGSLRDSERVDTAEDRLVYLHEAVVLLRQAREEIISRPLRIENRLLSIIIMRWLGLVNAAIEELRGQAHIVVSLKTKRLVPKDGQTSVILEMQNKGRAPAENVTVRLDHNPAHEVEDKPAVVPVLPPGRSREISFCLEPRVTDRFRLSCTITYDDRSQEGRQIAFADMVHLLPPVREFTPIPNPYLPGTPLREHSTLFYGRQELFEFIAQNAGQISQRNVLILVGQRRTGKTSALLRLGSHLPENLLPVYIDCQSLGVVPGMAALFHDLAWLISDALATRDIELEVPEPAVWREDPAGYFQRRFLPEVRCLLSQETMLLLVFDEFEAFENLVKDEILPSTFFTYLRHLMQHSEGLSFIFVGTRRLEEMSTDYWSVLFNIALYRHIGFLSREAATQLVCDPVAPHIVYDDLALDKIWRVTAGQPYFLQLVCYTLVNQANNQGNGYVTISDVNAALEEMLRLGEVHFAYIWQRSTHTERALLTAVAHLMDRDVPFHPGDLMQYLEKYGFRLDPAEVTAALNRLVEREIMQEVTVEGMTLYELKIGLVGLWAEQNKSLSKLYESKNGTPATTSLAVIQK